MMTVETNKPVLTTQMKRIIAKKSMSDSIFFRDMEKLFEDAYTLGYYDGIEDAKQQENENECN